MVLLAIRPGRKVEAVVIWSRLRRLGTRANPFR
jgi:hypothetical protein